MHASECPDPDRVAALARRELSEVEARGVLEHLRGCPACATAARAAVRQFNALMKAPGVPGPATQAMPEWNLADAILGQLAERYGWRND